MTTYTEEYVTIAVNQSAAAMVSALAAAPLQTDIRAVMALTIASDVTTSSGIFITRTIVSDDGAGPLAAPQPATVLTNLESISFSRALSSQVRAAPVGVT
jgi:hypothetical protein